MTRLITLLLLVLPLFCHSSINVTGHFKVNKVCPAYVSKNKKSNPDNLFIQPGQQYPIEEINRYPNPEWIRIEWSNTITKNPLRWVEINCGVFDYQAMAKKSCQTNPGFADSYVLALSWLPAFCQTRGYRESKPECLHSLPNSFQASHLVLHGLWPNQQTCGQEYGFCNERIHTHYCDYPPVRLSTIVASNLRQMMPSYAYGGCLERYEWSKHGSCQTLSPDDYFSLAIRLSREANSTPLGKFLHEHVGATVLRVQLREAIRQSFGQNTVSKVYLRCKKDLLVDLYIQLPALIPANESLQNLVQQAPEFVRYDACPASIKISDFNKS
ncbi:ribonuclease T2 family protein [Legionella micdadei]|uniref:Ribonuclease T2 n=1 Tax=Legionella micdadei TaxID=451 RepID=A0A098GDL6_LEGMI|nr:ribonuclease T [Legionella micdadei]ARG96333.1 ribonuclease T [Legionella micdadei]ARG99085.1 ribonuclease T [Legionella micdadei]KTD29586.1 ribonuclease, T2 family [Legionella micdadei]NSL18017.1 ribonuclease T [Legionella micdadei]CEG59531.1 Ribonuclease, T2 family [Legionella micdadei]